MKQTNKAFLLTLLTVGLVLPPALLSQQDPQQPPDKSQQKNGKQKSNRELMKELEPAYKKWLNEDVVYIISPEERQAFLRLQTNEEREQFIEQFWLRRDPTPDTPENEFKEEHYRRIAYANEHFASGIPGWKADRGKIYIIWGKPDSIESHPSGGSYDRPSSEGGGETATFPFEVWNYRYLEGVGSNIDLEFVDTTMSGEYHLSLDPGEKDALAHVPGAGLTQMEAMGMSDKTQRFQNTDGTTLGTPIGQRPESMEEFTRLNTWAKVQQPPPVKFKDLEALVTSRIVRNQLSFDYRFDFYRVTDDTDMVPVTIQIPNRQMSFQEKEGVQTASLNLFVRISTLGGRVVQTFEDVIVKDFPSSLLQQSLKGVSVYQKAVPLRPGLYRLDIVIKDINSSNVGVVNTRLPVPRFEEDKLASSQIVLADEIVHVTAHEIGLGQFVVGDMKVRPKLDATFETSDNLGIYLQVYNLKPDEKTHQPNASILYEITKDGHKDGDAPVFRLEESTQQMGDHGDQITLDKTMKLASVPPGKYKLAIQITDNLAKQTISQSADFTVKTAAK
jgi:GWxTD domain-containing protein